MHASFETQQINDLSKEENKKKMKSNYIYNPGIQHILDSTQNLSILLNFPFTVLYGSQYIGLIKQ